jgi:flavin-dependent thymidylate synthase
MENKIELIGTYGSDLTHSLSAWTSTDRDLTDEKRDRIPQLLKYLADNQHETPFEKSSLHFLVTADIASHIHVIKHRIGISVNTESARYRELTKDKYYIPNDWSKEEQLLLEFWIKKSFSEYHTCIERLERKGISRKRAKESARYYLTYATQLDFDIMFNFRSFIHFQKLRNDKHAQVEIREIAQKMLELVKETNQFNYSLKAFGY